MTDAQRVLVFGEHGQLAKALARCLPDAVFVSRATCDLAQPNAAAACIAQHAPQIVINASAYTAVDRAESDVAACEQLNHHAPAEMARACAEGELPFLHVSTDYVFDGEGERAYREHDPIAPSSVYGASKARGEDAVRNAHARHLILRTSWVFSADGQNFVRTMLRLGRERDEVRVVADQHGKPTSADVLARAACVAIERLRADASVAGTYHVACAEPTTWHGFAQAIFELQLKHELRAPKLTAITTADYPTPAKRPKNSVLDTTKFEQTFSHPLISWRDPLAQTVKQLVQSEGGT